MNRSKITFIIYASVIMLLQNSFCFAGPGSGPTLTQPLPQGAIGIIKIGNFTDVANTSTEVVGYSFVYGYGNSLIYNPPPPGQQTPEPTDFAPITILKPFDPSSINLAKNLARGLGVPGDVKIHFYSGTNNYYSITLTGVITSKISPSMGGSSGDMQEMISLTYSTIRWEYTVGDVAITDGWDVEGNGPL